MKMDEGVAEAFDAVAHHAVCCIRFGVSAEEEMNREKTHQSQALGKIMCSVNTWCSYEREKHTKLCGD